jgi:cytochrome c oxidase cbb3-type subunit I/II
MMFYVVPMYWSGITQGLMWKQFTSEGFMQYPNFLETVLQLIPMYRLRAVGGSLYIIGAFLMAFNLWKTAKSGQFVPEVEVQAAPLSQTPKAHEKGPWGHRFLEAKPMLLTVLAFVAVLIGGLVEIVPMYLIKENVPTISAVKPYTALELLGRDLYIREGCVGCHSQMVRPFRSETERYGDYSKAGEFIYEHPFLWGSKRTGPDLHRVGGKYPDAWHYNHMDDPASTSPGSIMPRYPWLLTQKLDTSSLPARIKALRKTGVPYQAGYEQGALAELNAQAAAVVGNLKTGSITTEVDKEIVALIAYLQRLGTDIKVTPTAPSTPVPATAQVGGAAQTAN